MSKRTRTIDNTKQLTRCDRLSQFKKLQTHDADAEKETEKSEKIQASHDQIVTPYVGLAQNYEPQRLESFPHSYIRLKQELNLPLPDQYELTEFDLAQIQHWREENKFSFSEEVFQDLIQSLELNSGKESTIGFEEALVLIPKSIQNKTSEQIFQEIYKHWVKCRERLQRPLLRQFWRANADDNNPHLAFRPRQKEKMKLRKAFRLSDQENYQKYLDLKVYMNHFEYLVAQMHCREQFKQLFWKRKCLGYLINNEEKAIAFCSENLDAYETKLDNQRIQTYLKLKEIRREISKLPTVETKSITHNYLQTEEYRRPDRHKYIDSETYNDNFQHQQHEPIVQEGHEQNFDLASFISTTYALCYQQGVRIDSLNNMEAINKLRKMHESELTAQLFDATSNHDLNQNPSGVERQEKQRTNFCPFKLRKRIGRHGIVILDRILESESQHMSPLHEIKYFKPSTGELDEQEMWLGQKLTRLKAQCGWWGNRSEDESESDEDTLDFKLARRQIQTAVREFNKKKVKH